MLRPQNRKKKKANLWNENFDQPVLPSMPLLLPGLAHVSTASFNTWSILDSPVAICVVAFNLNLAFENNGDWTRYFAGRHKTRCFQRSERTEEEEKESQPQPKETRTKQNANHRKISRAHAQIHGTREKTTHLLHEVCPAVVGVVQVVDVLLPDAKAVVLHHDCLLYTSPSPRDGLLSRMPSSA